MIHFNELYIKDQHLIIDVSVLNEEYYDNVYLDKIVIDNQDTRVNNFPSDTPIYQYDVPDINNKFTRKTVGSKHARIILDQNDINLNDMLFVYVIGFTFFERTLKNAFWASARSFSVRSEIVFNSSLLIESILSINIPMFLIVAR